MERLTGHNSEARQNLCRIDEQIYPVYDALNLTAPPQSTTAANFAEEREMLSQTDFYPVTAIPGVNLAASWPGNDLTLRPALQSTAANRPERQ